MLNKLNREMESSNEKNKKNLIKIPGKENPINPNSLIDGSKYFTWAEALNTPYRIPTNWQITQGIIRLALALDPIRETLAEPIHITSWYRDPTSNHLAGGVPNSEHLLGIAADWYCDSYSPSDIEAIIGREWKGGLGIYSSWVHTDLGGFARW